MLSWCDALGDLGWVAGTSLGRSVILLLLTDSGIDGRGSPETAFREQTVQVDQSGQTNVWCTHLHSCARDRIQHPRWYCHDLAQSKLDVHNIANGALLAIVPAYAAPIERVPPIMNLDFPPDMGRMFG